MEDEEVDEDQVWDEEVEEDEAEMGGTLPLSDGLH